MQDLRPSRKVQLMRDVPELGLSRGETGTVCSIWCAPATAYEVEFDVGREKFPARVHLLAHQFSICGEHLPAD